MYKTLENLYGFRTRPQVRKRAKTKAPWTSVRPADVALSPFYSLAHDMGSARTRYRKTTDLLWEQTKRAKHLGPPFRPARLPFDPVAQLRKSWVSPSRASGKPWYFCGDTRHLGSQKVKGRKIRPTRWGKCADGRKHEHLITH